jgi:hypothetical protein
VNDCCLGLVMATSANSLKIKWNWSKHIFRNFYYERIEMWIQEPFIIIETPGWHFSHHLAEFLLLRDWLIPRMEFYIRYLNGRFCCIVYIIDSLLKIVTYEFYLLIIIFNSRANVMEEKNDEIR